MKAPVIVERELLCLGCFECWERQRLAKVAEWQAGAANRAERNREKFDRIINAKRARKSGTP